MNLKRRITQYIMGLVLMAVALVFIKRLGLGISPISSVPDAISMVTGLTLGNVTIAFHVVCVIGQIIVMRRVTVRTLLTLPLAIAFGYLIDFFMLFIDFSLDIYWLKILLQFPCVMVAALGIVLIVGADLMLPAPDALFRSINAEFNIPLSRVKVCGDIIWVIVSVSVDLISSGGLRSVGLGTVISALFMGRFVGIFNKHFPQITMQPLEIKKKEQKKA